MSQVTVVVTFYSRGGVTEAMAHAAAVGSVQERALIRLRRAADVDPQTTIARFPEAKDTLTQMHKEYVALREADVLAASGLIFTSPADVDASAPEWAPVLELLARLHSEGKLAGKVAGVVAHGASASLSAALGRLGLPVIDGADASAGDGSSRAVALGRQVAAAARAARTNA